MPFGGLDSNLRYYEYELDSAAADYSRSQGISARNWPLFKLGGKKPLENIAGIKILEAQIPFAWYIFNSTNNTFILTESGFASVIVTLPVGNFTSTQMATILQNALTLVSPNTLTYTVSFDSTIQKFTYYNNAATSIPFQLTVSDFNTSPGDYLGLPVGATISQGFLASGTPKGDYLVSPGVASITGPNYLYLNSTKMGNLTDIYLPVTADGVTGGNSGPQMAKIPVNVQPGGTISWQDPTPQMFFDLENLNSLNEIDFFLTLGNLNQAPLPLNGASFSIKIGILVNEFSNSSVSSGSLVNDRVRSRIFKR